MEESNLLFAGTIIQFSENELARLENAMDNSPMMEETTEMVDEPLDNGGFSEMESNFLSYSSETETNEPETGGNYTDLENEYEDQNQNQNPNENYNVERECEYEYEYNEEMESTLKSTTLEPILNSEIIPVFASASTSISTSTNELSNQDEKKHIITTSITNVIKNREVNDEKRDIPLPMSLLSSSFSSSSLSSLFSPPSSPSLSTLSASSIISDYSLAVFGSQEIEVYRREGIEESKEDVIVNLLELFRSSPIRCLVFLSVLLTMIFDHRHRHRHPHHRYHYPYIHSYSHPHQSHCTSSSLPFCESSNAVFTCPNNNCVQLFVTRVEYWKMIRSQYAQQQQVCDNPDVNMFEYFSNFEHQKEKEKDQEKDQEFSEAELQCTREQTLCRSNSMFEYRKYYHISHPLPFEMILNPHPIFLLCAMHF